jgi:hypothetical protein
MPTQWRDLSDIAKAEYCHKALQTFEPVHAYTLNLRHDIEALARTKPNSCQYVRDRMAAELRKGLGRRVDFIAAFEEADVFDEVSRRWRPRLHVHGEMAVSVEEAELARACLRRAGGEWETNRQHQAKTWPDPDDGWVGYIAKDFWKTTPFMRNMMKGSRIFGVTFDGDVFSATRPVTLRATTIFEQDRKTILREISSKCRRNMTG